MNKFYLPLIGIVSILTISCTNPESNNTSNASAQEQSTSTIKKVQVSDLKSAMTNDASVAVLDVRTAGEVAQGFVENAINVDVNGSAFDTGVKDLDKSKTVYVYCRSGHRSMIASKKLISLGFSDVRNVEGGFMAWEQAGYPVVK